MFSRAPFQLRPRKSLKPLLALATAFYACGVFCATAQHSTHVRVFKPGGSYPVNITLSPTGSVLSRSADSSSVLVLDGYARTEIPLLVETSYRVYQSRSAQLWSVTREGLQLYHGGEWSLHPIPEIRNELANNPLRPLRQITLLPAEVNHVLILLSDRLLDYDAGTRQSRTLRSVADTRLGEFLEIQEGADESVWISGLFGLAQVPGPVRRITPQTEWKEYILPNTNRVNTLQRAFEFPPGTVTASANSVSANGSRFIVRLENDGLSHRFSSLEIPGEKIKQGWGGWDGSIWGYSSTALFRIERQPELRLRKEPVSGAQYDMSTETNGTFWIASSEGLVRYAPFLWSAPAGWEDLSASVHSLAFDRSTGVTWAATPEGIIRRRGESLEPFPWPETVENQIPPRDSLFVTGTGLVIVGTQGRPLVFAPETKRFSFPTIPDGTQAHLLGELRNGTVCFWFETEANRPADLRSFDGKEFQKIPLPPFNTNRVELITVLETTRGDLWFGTSKGLIVVRSTAETIEEHGLDQGLSEERVTSIAELGEGRMWCGTVSQVFEFVDRRWESRLKTSDRVTSIVSAHGSTWVGTPAGVFRWMEGSWIPNRAPEGIPGGGVYAMKRSPSDQLWAATSRGVVRFHPDADPDPPKTVSPIVQDPQTPSTIEPTVVSFRGQDKWDYTAQSDLLFSYKLDDSPWTPFSNHTTRVFQNLSSGAHVIEVRAMDRNGNQSKNTSSVEFAVIVPWFRDPRLLFVSLFALCVTFILAGFAINKHFQLKRSYAEVERIVRQRTGELEKANQELLHSQKMRAIGTMAAGIAHDFNNILSIIKGSVQIIEGNVDDKEKIKTRVNRISTVVEQGTSIVKALLGLGRINEQELRSCDLRELLNETRKLLADRFSSEVQFEVDVEPHLPEVVCSREVLQQMLLNFILNAVESMGGKGIVRLSAKHAQTPPAEMVLEPTRADSYVVVSVSDHGTGIPAETLPRIFEPFFTTKGFSSRRGTGLGLSMVYELAKGLGYGVSVRSTVGQGSSFSICLPLKSESPKADPRSEGAQTQPSSTLESRR